LSPERYEMLSLGHETPAAYAKADDAGQPMFHIPAGPSTKAPFLSHASGAYRGRLVRIASDEANFAGPTTHSPSDLQTRRRPCLA